MIEAMTPDGAVLQINPKKLQRVGDSKIEIMVALNKDGYIGILAENIYSFIANNLELIARHKSDCDAAMAGVNNEKA